MTDSIRELILAAFFTKISGVSGVTAYRNRDTGVPEDSLPAVVQRDGGMTRDYDGINELRVSVGIDVECYVDAATDALLGAAMSDLYARVTQAALSDRTLGGLAIDVIEADEMMSDPVIDYGSTDKPNAAFTLFFVVSFSVNPGDPYSPAP